MGFWDEYEDEAAGPFVGEDETKKLVKNKTTFEITAVRRGDDRFGDGFQVTLDIGGEVKVKRFAADSGVDSRNRQLDAMQKYFEADGEPILARLEYAGQALLIKPAE